MEVGALVLNPWVGVFFEARWSTLAGGSPVKGGEARWSALAGESPVKSGHVISDGSSPIGWLNRGAPC